MSNNKNKFNLRYILIFTVCMVALMSCEDPVQIQVQDEILGLWRLREQSGTASNICENELVQFNANGIAGFECPGFEPVTVPYTAANNVLTFTETGTQYSISKPADTTLVLTGITTDKTLKYGKE
jgi:hypothetical protein